MDKSEIAIRGTVAQQPELNRTKTGKVYTRINVAADEVSVDGQKIDAKENKWHSVVFWSADAVDMARNVKQGAQVAVSGEQVIRQVEGRDGEMKTFSEIHRGQLTVEKEPKPRGKGADVEMKGEVLYDPELKAAQNGKYYTQVTIRPENGSQKVRAAFFEEAALDCARSVHKGAQVMLKGELVEKEYTTKEGVPTKSLEIEKASIELLDKQQGAQRPVARGKEMDQGLGG